MRSGTAITIQPGALEDTPHLFFTHPSRRRNVMNLNLSFRRVYAVTVIAVGLLLLTACNITGGSAPKSLAGSWKDGTFTATVDATSIEVYWTSDDTKSLYWVGTFDGNKKP